VLPQWGGPVVGAAVMGESAMHGSGANGDDRYMAQRSGGNSSRVGANYQAELPVASGAVHGLGSNNREGQRL
jgi:hypothetical protein